MGFLDELKKLTKPYAEEEDEYDYDEEEEVAEEEEAEPEKPSRRSAAPEPSYNGSASGVTSNRREGGRVVNLGTPQLQVVLVKPDRFENVSEIADNLRDKHAVLLNMENTDPNMCRRVVDFLSGCAYAVDGKIKKVATRAYLITPYNIEIVGDLVEELENNGVYF